MNIEHMAGQRIIMGFEGLTFNDQLKAQIKDFKPCGLILFSYNIESPEQVQELCADARQYASDLGLPPLIICVDQEGGTVARFKEPWTVFDEGQPAIHTEKEARHFASVTAQELLRAGVNMNLTPVLDVVPKSGESIMKKRAFPGDATSVGALGRTVISELQRHGMMAVAKHFPGIGSTVMDSHYHLPVLDQPLERLEAVDLLPFIEAIRNDVTGIMLSHIFYPQIDPDWQASLSPVLASDLLRTQLGFDGLVFTDDMDMKAIKHDISICMHQVLKADIDITLICHQGPNIHLACDALRRYISSDPQLYRSAEQSVDRIMRVKKRYL